MGLRFLLSLAPEARAAMTALEADASPDEWRWACHHLSRQVVVAQMKVLEGRALARLEARPQEFGPPPEHLVLYAREEIDSREARRRGGYRDHATLLVELGRWDLDLPMPPEEVVEAQAETFARVWNGS